MHATSIYIARKQFICHQTVERTQARSEELHTHVVRALLYTRVFMKFKSSCTVVAIARQTRRLHVYMLRMMKLKTLFYWHHKIHGRLNVAAIVRETKWHMFTVRMMESMQYSHMKKYG